MKIDDASTVLLATLMSKHPGLVEEVDDMARGLSDQDKGALYRKLLYQPVDGSGLEPDEVPSKGPGDVQPTGPIESARPIKSVLPILSADEITQTVWPEPIWAVPGLLPVGLVILAGAPKIGKSWLSLQLAKAIATGGGFLGLPAQRGKVLVCALEDSPQRLQKRMQAIGWPNNLAVDFLTLAQMKDQPGGLLRNDGGLLASLIEQKGYQLVVIDTLSRAIQGDQQDVKVMTRELTPLQEMSHRLNCAVMLCDHHRKAGGVEGDAVADILGSTAKGAMADTIWSLYRERGKRGAKLSITGRDVEEQTLPLAFDMKTCCWENLGSTTGPAIPQRRQEVLDVINQKGKATLIDIAQATNQPKSHTHRRLQDLVDAGLVTRLEEGKYVFYVPRELPVVTSVTSVTYNNEGEQDD